MSGVRIPARSLLDKKRQSFREFRTLSFFVQKKTPIEIKNKIYQKSKKHIEYTKRNEYTKHITYDQLKGGNTYEEITHKAVHCNADIDIYSNNEHSGKDKD